MSLPIVLALLWLVTANVIALFPSPKRQHWPAAYGLIAVGIPILIWVVYEEGWLIGAVALIAGGSVLRWPVRYLFRWIGRRLGLKTAED
ncbi:MAG: DUF2484 family protein [Pseudomonadota bacterium]